MFGFADIKQGLRHREEIHLLKKKKNLPITNNTDYLDVSNIFLVRTNSEVVFLRWSRKIDSLRAGHLHALLGGESVRTALHSCGPRASSLSACIWHLWGEKCELDSPAICQK